MNLESLIRNELIYLYLQEGKDVKDSKQKTKVQKKSLTPVFDEVFEYGIPKAFEAPEALTRLQITVLNNGDNLNLTLGIVCV